MKGMSMEDITLMLKFIYTGEVVVEKGNVEHFLAAANELKIAGLTKSNNSKEADSDSKQTVDDTFEEKAESEQPVQRKARPRKSITTTPSNASDEMNNNECDICGAEHKSGKAF